MGHRWLFALALSASGCSFDVPSTFIPGDGPDAPVGGDGPDAPDGGNSACRAVEVSAMSAHTCARMENGDVWCWGINGIGEVGRPAQNANCHNGVPCNPTPEKLVLPAVTKLGVAEEHSCAIAGTDVYCWGRDDKSQFGDGDASTVMPRLVGQRTGAKQIVGGLEHGCSLHGTLVKCSGTNGQGEVGDTTVFPRPMPVTTIPSGTDRIASGYQHMCAIESGFIYCWGADFGGQVNTSPGGPVRTPSIVAGVAQVSAAGLGYGHTCVVRGITGDVACWGTNDKGQLGVGDMMTHYTMVVQAQVSGVVDMTAGSDHTCARTPAGSMYCWGDTAYGPTPVQVPLPRPAVSIASGSYHDCAALDDGTVWCLGWNAYGQLGLGTADNGTTLVASKVRLCP